MRQRVAALIQRHGRLLVVRQRSRGQSGRHDGPPYLTPPGGGVEAHETLQDAVVREVKEEVGLDVVSTTFVTRLDHRGGNTALFSASVADGDPVLGFDPEIECDCPRLVGIEWVPAPPLDAWRGADALSLLKVVVADERREP
ncbi:NUDIX domain-containing protein [Flexivirga oryzae]|uniref:8-oxo-dGTP diphosphatase n=1 Tax=Flexivirga oryzae TaxID=1794944 RepID=A0A839N3L2_9MICO|nr:NUDIX hydrolase [Flexivirga oryzae]MBB2892340.1 8-oxo-dGTP diphosphatase [Flexivirga oryzae]